MKEYQLREVLERQIRKEKRRLWIKIILWVLFFFLVFGVVCLIMVILAVKTLPIENMNQVDYSSIIYDADGKEVARYGAEEQEYLHLEEINRLNKDLTLAFIKVEDERFFKHHGVDWLSLMRAAWVNMISFSSVEGGGTITMQVARNVILEDRTKTFIRKLKELFVALEIEKIYSKEEILEAYLNHIDFGYQVKGVQMAAKIYFGKDLTKHKLEAHEIALLAGLPKAPYGYNPYGTKKQQKKALHRRNVVLTKMTESTSIPSLITNKEKEIYQKRDLGVNKNYLQKYLRPKELGAYKNVVRRELEERYNISERELMRGGFRVYTALNLDTQKIVEKALKDDRIFHPEALVNAAIVVMNPQNGRIEAVGGGRNYHQGTYNWALQPVQPGTVIRPLTVYAPAVQMGLDKLPPLSTNNKATRVETFALDDIVKDEGNKLALEILRKKVTLSKSLDYGQKLGFPLEQKDANEIALAMGSWRKGVSTKELAQAYSVFPNNGKMVRAHAVLRVFDHRGEEVRLQEGEEIDRNGNPVQMFQAETAQYMMKMFQKKSIEQLENCKIYQIDCRQFAGYSGYEPGKNNAWFVGFTPNFLTVVMAFNDTVDRRRGQAELTGDAIPARLFAQVMASKQKEKPAEPQTDFSVTGKRE
jgi:penicillin-binding protein 2A